MVYTEHEVKISAGEKKRLEAKLRRGRERGRGGLTQKTLTIKTINDNGGGEKVMLLLTRQQIARLQKATRSPTTIIKMRKRQILANMKVEGGFLGMLAGLAARALPTLLTGLASGVLSGVVENAITSKKSSKTNGNGVYIQKGKHCYRADPVEGDGLFLSRATHRYPRHTDGIYVQDGPNVHDGKGILFGKNSPFRNIPILGWLL